MLAANALIALASAFTTAVYFVYTSQVMKRHPEIGSGVTLAAGHIAAALALLPVWWLSRPEPAAISVDMSIALPLLAAAGLLVLSRQLYFYAYAHTDVANITVFSALTPVYALATGFFMLGEVPKPLPLVGMLLICASLYAMFLRWQHGLSLARNIAQPFVYVASSKPVLCAFLSTIPTAFAATFQKELMAHLDPVTFSLALLALIGGMATVILAARRPVWAVMAQVRQLPIAFLLASAVLLPLVHVLFCLVIREHQTAVSLVLQRLSIVFQIALAYAFLGEKRDTKKRALATLCILTGLWCMVGG